MSDLDDFEDFDDYDLSEFDEDSGADDNDDSDDDILDNFEDDAGPSPELINQRLDAYEAKAAEYRKMIVKAKQFDAKQRLEAVRWLGEAGYITGTGIVVDGGYTTR